MRLTENGIYNKWLESVDVRNTCLAEYVEKGSKTAHQESKSRYLYGLQETKSCFQILIGGILTSASLLLFEFVFWILKKVYLKLICKV